MTIVAVVGSGLMGRGIAACCSNGGGCQVRMYDKDQERLGDSVKAALDQTKFLADAQIGVEGGTIVAAATLEEAVKDADFIFEAVFENVELKNSVFKEIEQLASPKAIMATNTSSLSVKEIGQGLVNIDRFIAAHFIGPAHLVPLVELCPSEESSLPSVKAAEEFLLKIGKKPVILQKEIPGFLAARLQAALYREAMHLVEEGVASADMVDKAVVNGFGRRLNQIGPFQVGDFAGVDLIKSTHKKMFPTLGSYTSDIRSEKLVEEGRNGVKSLKGNYEWTSESAAATAQKRDAELLRRLKEDFSK